MFGLYPVRCDTPSLPHGIRMFAVKSIKLCHDLINNLIQLFITLKKDINLNMVWMAIGPLTALNKVYYTLCSNSKSMIILINMNTL